MNTIKQGQSFLTRYRTNIIEKLKSIDLFLKTKPCPYDKKETAKILELPYDEFEKIISEYNIDAITPHTFVLIMKSGSSELCRAFRRELECGLTDTYTPDQVSYIYNIDIDIVLNAYAVMGVSALHKGLLETLFSNIYV
ncbi:hypothetical protein IMSAG049_01252 [Clostridiales bacterium]|nr:hypothetical protein IMSAG049_01252 [Clostridiales bacterium]